MALKLDMKDRMILHELEKDARQPISQIAKKIRLSKETTNYKIKRMEREGIIVGYFTIINSAALGYNRFRLFLRFQNTTPKKEAEIIDYFRKIPMLTRLVSAEGNWDLTTEVRAKNVFEFKRIYDELISRYGAYIEDKYISIITKIYYFLHDLLYNIKDRSYFTSEEELNVKTDETDMQIIMLLIKNCRLSASEIAKKLDLNAATVKNRIKHLIKEKVIVAFRIVIDDNYFEYQHHHILLTFQNIDKEKKMKLISTLSQNPYVFSILEVLGESDLEFDVHIKRSVELYNLLKELRSRFSCIKDHQTLMFSKSHPF